MKNYNEVPTIKKELKSVICDKCGIEILPLGDQYYSFDYTGGYYSEYPGDNMHIEADICEKCLKELVSGFVRETNLNDARDY